MTARCGFGEDRKASSSRLISLVPDQGDNHTVEVEEEHDKVESKLEERLLHHVSTLAAVPVCIICILKAGTRSRTNLLVSVQRPENLGRVEKVRIVKNPRRGHQLAIRGGDLRLGRALESDILLDIERKQGQVQDQGDPVTVDQEESSEQSMNGSLGDDVGVEAVAEVDRVDIVAFEIREHDDLFVGARRAPSAPRP